MDQVYEETFQQKMKYRPYTYRKQHATLILRKVYNETHPEKPLFPDELSRDEKT